MPSPETMPTRLSSNRQIRMTVYFSGMRVCVFGAGAVGGHIAAKLAASGNEVSVVARGPHLQAVQRNGLKLLHGDETILGRVRASERPAELGPQRSEERRVGKEGRSRWADVDERETETSS